MAIKHNLEYRGRYSDDRVSLAQEIRETLSTRGYWVPDDWAGPDLITAVATAIDTQSEHSTMTEQNHAQRHKELHSALDGLVAVKVTACTEFDLDGLDLNGDELDEFTDDLLDELPDNWHVIDETSWVIPR